MMEVISETKTNLNTKVVDGEGKPLVMYHGGSYSDGEFRGEGWFTTSKSDAKYYAKQNDGVVTSAYLIVNDPLYTGYIKDLNIKLTKDIVDSITKRNIKLSVENGIITYIEANDGVLIAKDLGKDGVIDLDGGEILDVVVFSGKQITRIQSMMELNESFTGDTPTDIRQYFINKPVKLIGDLNTTTKIQDLIVNKDGSVNITFQNGVRLDSSIPMLTSFSVGINIPLQFKVRKKTTKLQEEHSQETSGINKQSRTQKIERMIDKTGIVNTVNVLGGYNNFIKIYDKELTKSDKIKFICDIVGRYGEDSEYGAYGNDSEPNYLDVLKLGIGLDYIDNDSEFENFLIELIGIYDDGDFDYYATEHTPEDNGYDWDNTYRSTEHLDKLSTKKIDEIFKTLIMYVK